MEVKILKDSISESGHRITTYQLKYPRIIHSEFMTHRVFSRNASSSRAIPVHRLVATVKEDFFLPKFRYNKPGMQPGLPLSDADQLVAEGLWKDAADACMKAAMILGDDEGLNVHKQWANRMLEWFTHINVVVTSTAWSNFFALRRDIDENGFPVAQDEMFQLAQMMQRAMQESEPMLLKAGEWHLPYVNTHDKTQDEIWNMGWESPHMLFDAIRVSVARCARVSYYTHEGKKPTLQKEFELYNRLVGSTPMHASAAEHQATPHYIDITSSDVNLDRAIQLQGNFKGWKQYRKMLPNESL